MAAYISKAKRSKSLAFDVTFTITLPLYFRNAVVLHKGSTFHLHLGFLFYFPIVLFFVFILKTISLMVSD